MTMHENDSYWLRIARQYARHKLGVAALIVLFIFCLAGIYAPFLASGKPLVVRYDDVWYFPLFRYLFYQGYFTKGLDLFFNLLMFTFPLFIALFVIFRKHKSALAAGIVILSIVQLGLFSFLLLFPLKDPGFDPKLSADRQIALATHPMPSWDFDLKFLNPYAKLNLILRYRQLLQQHERLKLFRASLKQNESVPAKFATLWETAQNNEQREINRLNDEVKNNPPDTKEYLLAKASLNYINDKREWLIRQPSLIDYDVMPLIRPFHWEEDAGGDQAMNSWVPFWELTRINRKDLAAALIFGIRISLVVGLLSVGLALLIGLPIGALAGYYGGTFDIIVSRMLEIWEAMPTFFMLLMVVAITQSKSIFLVIAVIGIFGWTSFSRYLRGEFFKQRSLPYIEACRAQGFNDRRIIFTHILPNAIPPVLTLLPFAIMGAITSEAGLSFLGLGEEASSSWGVLMDEGRSAFPSESYLLWPPAILLTILLVAIAIVGDHFRDALDPKMQR